MYDDVNIKLLANAIRFLSIDAIETANSGHPGMPMGMADVASILYLKHFNHSPEWPEWPDRDRFILSAGHGSMLLYSLMHLTGYKDISLEEIKNFRQLGSKTPGHPEFGIAKGIETTTGPLGQGIGTAVGMALAERMLNARFNDKLVNHWTYVIAGDGCLMEGISHESCSLAAHLGLNKLIVFFDNNQISIDGPTSLSTSENIFDRFKSLGWDVQDIDGHNPSEIDNAINSAKKTSTPSLIGCKTIIGFGAKNKQGSSGVHGSPLGKEETLITRKNLNWPHEPFHIPKDILNVWRNSSKRSLEILNNWKNEFKNLNSKTHELWKNSFSDNFTEIEKLILPYKKEIINKPIKIATRKASQDILEILSPNLPNLIGGSADLTGSNNTLAKDMKIINKKNYSGKYIHYGVREHGMAAAMNGLSLHGGFIPYGGTFLVFTDYLRPSLRLSALMKQKVIYVMSHDSIGLGEDGPTHQPIEHLSSLRSIPNLYVFRPADATETAESWALAISNKNKPSIIALSRQGLSQTRTTYTSKNLCSFGAYELSSSKEVPKVSLFASGSEVSLALSAKVQLEKENIPCRVISMPCWELFDEQDISYKNYIIDKNSFKIAIEAGIRHGWDKYIGNTGHFIGLETFGESAPIESIYKHFNITTNAIVDAAKAGIGK
ncbi:transketolase [Alphaproteobacteria bacterium]|nr:transketolase [Alphaproteobacteria bacterium]